MIGKKIRYAREYIGLDQKSFGEKIDVTPITVEAYETEQKGISLDMCRKMAGVLGCSIEYLTNDNIDVLDIDNEEHIRKAKIRDIVVGSILFFSLSLIPLILGFVTMGYCIANPGNGTFEEYAAPVLLFVFFFVFTSIFGLVVFFRIRKYRKIKEKKEEVVVKTETVSEE